MPRLLGCARVRVALVLEAGTAEPPAVSGTQDRHETPVAQVGLDICEIPAHRNHRRATVNGVDRPELLEKVSAVLVKAEARPPGAWDITIDDEDFIVSVCELFEIPVPLDVFASSEAAVRVLRLVAVAVRA